MNYCLIHWRKTSMPSLKWMCIFWRELRNVIISKMLQTVSYIWFSESCQEIGPYFNSFVGAWVMGVTLTLIFLIYEVDNSMSLSETFEDLKKNFAFWGPGTSTGSLPPTSPTLQYIVDHLTLQVILHENAVVYWMRVAKPFYRWGKKVPLTCYIYIIILGYYIHFC